MGAQMTKELGLYNEEEKVCTPTGSSHQRFKLLNCDPRSATAGIIRTPIQIESTPVSVKKTTPMKSSLEFSISEDENSGIIEGKNKTQELSSEKINLCLDEISDPDNESMECECPLTKAPAKYLETDIDETDSVSQFDIQQSNNADFPQLESASSEVLKKSEEKITKLFPDVRSPSLDIARTPVMVVCTPELFALHSRIDSLSFCDFESNTEDPSVVVSEDDQSANLDNSNVNNWLTDVENKVEVGFTPFNESLTDSPKTVAKKQKEFNALKKKLFFTPDVKETAKAHVRTPLGNLQAGLDSPKRILKSKQWRNIQEERQKLGLSDAENTPPSLPPLSKVASAPGKMVDRKRSNYDWSHDNTMLI